MKKNILNIIFCLCCICGFSQNLVNNPSFEDFKGYCPNPPQGISFNQDTILTFQTLYYWNNGYSLNPCGIGVGGAGIYTKDCGMVPNAQYGSPLAKDGITYSAVSISNNSYLLDERLYLQTALKQPMQVGKYYNVSFWAHIPTKPVVDIYSNILAPNAIAGLLTTYRPELCYNDSIRFLKANPQIILPENKYIDDTVNWQKVCGYYLAQGGERWLTIGNFYDSVHTKFKSILFDSNRVYLNTYNSYCFIDLVSVELAESAVLPSKRVVYLCDTTNGSDTLYAQTGFLTYKWNTGDTTPFLVVNKPNTYWVTVTDECGSFTDSAYVIYSNAKALTVSDDIIKCADNKPIELQANAGFNNYLWSTGDTSTRINVLQSGNYWVKASYECGTLTDTVRVIVHPIPEPPITENVQYCLNDLAKPLSATGNALKWYSQSSDTAGSDSAPLPSTNIQGSKDYFVTQRINDCVSPKSRITVYTITKPTLFLGNDTVICIGDTINIGTANNYYHFFWNDGDTLSIKSVSKEGIYIQRAMNKCGVAFDTIDIITKSCADCIRFPNAFSPNRDGINDTFFPRLSCDVDDYHLQIFNRFGNKVFETFQWNEKWNGVYGDSDAVQDSYVYVCTFRESGIAKAIRGTLMLLR